MISSPILAIRDRLKTNAKSWILPWYVGSFCTFRLFLLARIDDETTFLFSLCLLISLSLQVCRICHTAFVRFAAGVCAVLRWGRWWPCYHGADETRRSVLPTPRQSFAWISHPSQNRLSWEDSGLSVWRGGICSICTVSFALSSGSLSLVQPALHKQPGKDFLLGRFLTLCRSGCST